MNAAPLQPFGPGVWLADGPRTEVIGFRYPTRMAVIRLADGAMPILGVCLGHQAIGQVYGGSVVRAPEPMHGKLSRIHHTGKSVFRGLNNDFNATRYHSLTIDPPSMPASLEITATSEDGVIQGVMHKTHPVHGVQFHPESIASENGHALLENFLKLTRAA